MLWLLFINFPNQLGLYKSVRTDFQSLKRNNHLYTKYTSGAAAAEATRVERPGVCSRPGGGL